eukprot:4681880-Pyramimonas_sp.AAC.2
MPNNIDVSPLTLLGRSSNRAPVYTFYTNYDVSATHVVAPTRGTRETRYNAPLTFRHTRLCRKLLCALVLCRQAQIGIAGLALHGTRNLFQL